jgi:hypothetical protein
MRPGRPESRYFQISTIFFPGSDTWATKHFTKARCIHQHAEAMRKALIHNDLRIATERISPAW